MLDTGYPAMQKYENIGLDLPVFMRGREIDTKSYMTDLNRITPKRLRPGSRIGIVAPAGPFDENKFEEGIQALEKIGFVPVIPSRLSRKKGYLAGDDTHRVSMIHRFFSDPSVDAILCARGGYGSMRILPLLDFSVIRSHPKIFIGFSDITVLLTALYSRCAMVTYHGPVVTSLGAGSAQTGDALVSAISFRQRIVIKAENGFILNPGMAEGPVIGGNLTLLSHLVGTPYAPTYDGHILFFEDCNEPPYRIDRMLTQMRLSGCLDGIAGLFLGQFKDCGAMTTIREIIAEIFQDRNIPIMGGFDIGHGRTNLTLPIGISARLETGSRRLSYLEPAVS
ncbi:MAG: LD-carboxypeptidase [Deltaproteobacteria bacterium]|nr:MAG: LD-carboxypeptidase [Deltaproteobacteria bacterium]